MSILVRPRSAIGSGDSLLAMYALFRLYDIPIGPQQFQLMAAAGAATAQEPWARLGSMEHILKLARSHDAAAMVG